MKHEFNKDRSGELPTESAPPQAEPAGETAPIPMARMGIEAGSDVIKTSLPDLSKYTFEEVMQLPGIAEIARRIGDQAVANIEKEAAARERGGHPLE